jgi:hypothetical protein
MIIIRLVDKNNIKIIKIYENPGQAGKRIIRGVVIEEKNREI